MKKSILPAVIVVAALAAAAFMMVNRPQPPSAPPVEAAVPVEVRSVHAEDVTFTVASQGTVQPHQETVLVAEVSGVVNSISDKLFVGGFFNAGEVVLTLDPADYEVAVTQAQANLRSAQAQLTQESAQAEQMRREWDASGRPRSEAPALALRTPFLEEAQARVLSAEAELARAERQLARTTVRAPYDGLIREKMTGLGQFMGTGSQIARIFATDYAEVRLPLSEQDLAWLELPRPGQPTQAGGQSPESGWQYHHRKSAQVLLRTSTAEGSQHWQAEIVRMEGVVDSSTRMHFAVARIQDPYGLKASGNRRPLAIGTFVNASIKGIRVPDIFTLPHSAVRNGTHVLVMDAEQRLQQRRVNIVRSDTEAVYIDSGLQNNDALIVSAVQVPVEGMKVNPVSRN